MELLYTERTIFHVIVVLSVPETMVPITGVMVVGQLGQNSTEGRASLVVFALQLPLRLSWLAT